MSSKNAKKKSESSEARVLWKPSAARVKAAQITAFMKAAATKHGIDLPDYDALHAFSVRHPDLFWRDLFDSCGVIAGGSPERVLLDREKMPGARWFPDVTLNFAENLLRRSDGRPAIIAWSETRERREISWKALRDSVARCAAALKKEGVGPGDRVAAFAANVPEAVVVMLAAASVGAVFSSCSPDFGTAGVLDRFRQIEPRILFAVEGYTYNTKTIDTTDRLAEIMRGLPTVKKLVRIPGPVRGAAKKKIAHSVAWKEFLGKGRAPELAFTRVPFDHPLYILYSSGTTGAPKCIAHGVGGTLLQHLKEHRLQSDVRPDDRLFYFTTCGWMMWNWMVTALASEATICLFDGSPLAGRGTILCDLVEKEKVTHFGTSAKYIDAVKKMGLAPKKTHDLGSLRTILSTGSPLVAESFDWIYAKVKKDVCVSSISGGTDIISCFVGGSPISPVFRGEIQKKGPGMDVKVFDDEGRSLTGRAGELVCTTPFPSMTIGFWNDLGGFKYRAAYFERYPNVWAHGDWVELTPRGGMIIYGRSDATLNPGGVRIGTAEIYRQVEQLPEILESIAIGQDFDNDTRVVLFIRLADGVTLDDGLITKIKAQIRENTSPRHVPAKIVAVPDIPRTKSGKITELAVRDVVHGRPIKNREALANPQALEHYKNLPELSS